MLHPSKLQGTFRPCAFFQKPPTHHPEGARVLAKNNRKTIFQIRHGPGYATTKRTGARTPATARANTTLKRNDQLKDKSCCQRAFSCRINTPAPQNRRINNPYRSTSPIASAEPNAAYRSSKLTPQTSWSQVSRQTHWQTQSAPKLPRQFLRISFCKLSI